MYVPTGGMVPRGTEAVVMIEYTQVISDNEIAVYKNTSMYENMLRIGDDIHCGEAVLRRGKTLMAQDIGALTSTGHRQVPVFCRPKCAVISTGDEIIAPQSALIPGRINDINTYTISAQLARFGGDVIIKDVVVDDYGSIRDAISDAVAQCDVVFISGGSSVGNKDYTYKILDEMPNADLIVHGLNIKPGKPTIVANVCGKPVIGLPGQPASALIVLRQMLGILHEVYYGRPQMQTYVTARLDQNVAGAPGRQTYQVVTLGSDTDGGMTASVLRGKSGMISLLSRADGFIVIEAHQEGKEKGELVRVFPLS
jgi:molybdopterin molybdotransferase